MEKLLIITEKPSAKRAFATALGGEYGTFEGDEFVLVNLYGHILSLPEPMDVAKPAYKSRVGGFSTLDGIPWSPDYFDFTTKVIANDFKNMKKNARQTIKDYLNKGYIPVVASDIDAMCEGDLLVHEVLVDLNYNGKVYREYHVDETVKGIQKALREKQEIPVLSPAYLTGLARSSMDFLTVQLTRVATMSIKNKGYDLPGVVPMGRLKSVILWLVGDQLDKIKNYQPSSVFESRYQLDELILSNPDVPEFKTAESWTYGDLPLKSRVKEVKQTPGFTTPPKPLTLTTLSALASKKGLKPAQIKTLTQKMYEKGVITYPRTEDDFVTYEQFNDILPHVDTYIRLIGLSTLPFTHRTARTSHVKDKGAHGALRPGLSLPQSLDVLDTEFGYGAKIIYQLITERFLMMFLENTEWLLHEYETIDTPIPFTGRIKIITKQGVMDPDTIDPDIKTSLPDLNELAIIYPHEIKSKKPAQPTVSWLAKQLVKHNVGTPSTQLETIVSLVGEDEKQPIKDGKVLSLRYLGELGYIAAKDTIIGSVEGTQIMQDIIKKVKNNELSVGEACDQFTMLIKEDIEKLQTKDYPLDTLNVPKTENKTYAEGLWQGDVVRFKRQYGEYTFSDDEVARLLNGDVLEIQLGNKRLKGQLANLSYNGHDYVGFDGQYIREGYASGVWQGQQVSIKASYGQYIFSDNELKQLFDGQVITINLNGRQLSGQLANLTYNGNAYIGFKVNEQMDTREGYVSGVWQGQQVSFKRVFMGHIFTDHEVERLLNGEIVVMTGKRQNGESLTVSGQLARQMFKGKQFVGFKPDFGK